ncbi:MAG: ThiF family adenylyltransferase [Desulfovibrionaceae bacterium]|nr:ThiF family adenylyltransferase [Desulfovibrionaceae bacterium]
MNAPETEKMPDAVLRSLDDGIFPPHLLRNRGAFSAQEQQRLLRSKAVLVGLGGLGGLVFEQLLRAGVGSVLACDPDRFEESNLNRQILATTKTLAMSKADAALERAWQINPAAQVLCLARPFAEDMLSGADIVIDALGGAEHRAELLRTAHKHGLPVVSAGVAGWTALVNTSLPENPAGLGSIMGRLHSGTSDEVALGTPMPIVLLAAALQAAEALRLLCGQAPALAGKLLLADLTTMRFEVYPLTAARQEETV